MGVGNVPHIGFVDAHAESSGTGQNAQGPGNPLGLMVVTVGTGHSRMVGRR